MLPKKLDMIGLALPVMSRDMPEVVRLKEHSLDFVGRDPATHANLLTGAYGASSKQTLLVAGAAWSKKHQGASRGPNRVLQLDLNYRVDNYHLTREQCREDLIAQTGWVHLDRLALEYKDELKAQWLAWIEKDMGAARAQSVSDEKMGDLALRYPEYVPRMMKHDKNISVIVHPVHPVIDPEQVLWVATARYDRSRINDPKIRFLKDIKVIV